MPINLNDFKKIISNNINDIHRAPLIVIKRNKYEQVRNYLRDYAESNGLYFVELDEFTDIYIGEVIDLYKKMSNNNYCIIYLRMYDCIDYSQPHHQKALSTLYNILRNDDCNLQIVIDYHITDEDITDIHAFYHLK